jgi:hypothetical protein
MKFFSACRKPRQPVRRNAMGDVLAVEARVRGQSPRGPVPEPPSDLDAPQG